MTSTPANLQRCGNCGHPAAEHDTSCRHQTDHVDICMCPQFGPATPPDGGRFEFGVPRDNGIGIRTVTNPDRWDGVPIYRRTITDWQPLKATP